MSPAYNFGEILLSLREKSGLTQKQLAQRLGLKNSTISKYEVSASPPPALMVRRIAKEFGVSSDHLLGLEVSGTVSLHGLSDEQAGVISGLAELFRVQNISVNRSMTSEQYEMLGKVLACFLK